ncbi:MAG: 2-deoxy-D-gluconate 3-dehydrogenase [Rhizobiales bacterium 65-9]|mgnify:CR=1 FL=1|nr:glucose 1-dehydrogenase [Hyphomicrobiales bacterium]OJY37234.1 MAG: 2-deoxy-D-gluconate 3-dehydrogenase [Rhizobiales bacterium 65-9]
MDFAMSLEGRRALVTGASGGLGEHFAKLLARCGAHVAIAARRLDACERVRDDIARGGGKAVAIALDVSDSQSVATGVETAIVALGGLDILVNNAGVTATTPLLDLDESAWDRIIDTNLKGAFLAGQAAARAMSAGKQGGAIVNIASILGLRVAGQVAPYAAGKAGLVQLTKAMALEWARHDIRVNALCPGYVETDFNRDFFATEAGQALVRRIPQRRLLKPSDLDGALLLLCSDAGAAITGAAIPVDGGHLVSSL